MNDKISIWLIGNTGLRNPARIAEGFSLFASSEFVGKLHGKDEEYRFMRFLHDKGVIKNKPNKDQSASHARKWRLMFCKNGFIYPKLKSGEGDQSELGPVDDITPFGYSFLRARTHSAQQECYLRSLSVEQIRTADGKALFSPLRWTLALMLELERLTGSSEITRTEFALWGQASDPTYDLNFVVNSILDLRRRRQNAPSKRRFDGEERAKRAKSYPKNPDNFFDYCDMNMRYLRITGIVQRKGRGLVIVQTKHALAESLAKATANNESILDAYIELTQGARLPSDDEGMARKLLAEVEQIAKTRGVSYDISDIALDTVTNINIARLRIEETLQQTDEIIYAARQRDEWKEIVEYMKLIERGGGSTEDDDNDEISVPKDEMPAYLEWILWRATLAINHMVNKPYEVRGFKLDADFLPSSTASGGRGDLYCEFDDFLLVTEVSMSTGSRQEAMEGEPVRRHVSDAIDSYSKPVYGLFVAIKIDTNTAETFRHGTWYDQNDNMRRLDILPLTLSQYREFFTSMFRHNCASPDMLRQLIHRCSVRRDVLTGPSWKSYISTIVLKSSERLEYGTVGTAFSDDIAPAIYPGATVEHPVFGLGRVLIAVVAYDRGDGTLSDIPFAGTIPDNIELNLNGNELVHIERGHAVIAGYRVAFDDKLIYLTRNEMLELRATLR